MSNSSHKIMMGKLDEVVENIVIDYFIMVAHTDRRSFSGYDTLKNKHAIIKNIIVFDYSEQRPRKGSLDEKSYYRIQGQDNVVFVNCDKDNADAEYLAALQLNKDSTVWVDITSISIPSIFRFFYILKEIHGIDDYDVVYAEPKYYDFFNGLYFLYDRKPEPRDYRTLNEYFVSAGTRDVILVCFLGFEKYVSKYVHERNEHSKVIAINGFPSFLPKIKDISLEHNYELISAIGSDQVRYAQADTPFSTYNVLTSIFQDHENTLLDICVLGSKPMALGACMFALDHPEEVKVSYPFLTNYKKHTSIDVATTWWYSISF